MNVRIMLFQAVDRWSQIQNETGLTCQFDACTNVEVKLTSILLYSS